MLVYAGTCGCCVAIATRMVPVFAKCDVQLIKVVPDDGLTESETCRHLIENKV